MEKSGKAGDQAEQLRLQRESLDALLEYIPAMTFAKDARTGAYLFCNQAFAGFAHKETPQEVAGLTDEEIFGHRAAAHFSEDDQRALSMDQPCVYEEEAEDAAGLKHQLRTTKLKFYDEDGRECLLGMSLDVTEMEQAKKEREQARADYQEAVISRAAYESIVVALSEDYFNLYYVDLESGDFIEYGSRTQSGYHATKTMGTAFFEECKKNALIYIYEEDQKKFLSAMEKDTLLAEIKKHGMFLMQYRLLVEGEPVYVSLKATYGNEEKNRIIIGVNNIDAQVKDRAAALRASEDRKTYLRFSALNNNLIVLYLVDPETEQYSKFSDAGESDGLGVGEQGRDFFRRMEQKWLETVYPEDRELFHSQVTKENILSTIAQDGVFVLDYRMVNGDTPFYVRMKASSFEEDGTSKLIIGLLDEDAQIRHQRKIVDDLSVARRMATIDAMTGVKNKYAFSQAQERINQRIGQEESLEFSIVVFDLNDLKRINDTRGHEAGDAYIKEACKMICTCFKHSPVFRIGGDEFTAVLEGEDYFNQESLLEKFEKQVLVNIGRGRAVVSFGCARFEPSKDKNCEMVFERADTLMYTEKLLLKSLGAAVTEEEREKAAVPQGAGGLSLVNVRKHILIVDDIDGNREILGDLLKDDYDIYYAADGIEAMEMLRDHKDEIMLVLLDLYMPRMTGREVMNAMQVDEELMFIPVIFLSVDPHAELDCLKIGAVDFIPKPYPDIEIIKARIERCIELSENRDLIRRTQKDRLTGLYNIDYFFRYVNRYDRHYSGADFDAIVCSVNQFHSLYEQYGSQFGDLVQRNIGIGLKNLLRKTGGIGGRRERDAFLLYCPHRNDYGVLLKRFVDDLFFEDEIADKVTLRFGIYSYAQEEAEIEERFIRAKIAADRVERDPQKIYGFYHLTDGS